MDITILGGFTKFCPVLLSILCLMTFFNMFGRIMKMLGMSRFEYSRDYADDAIQEGKLLLRNEISRRKKLLVLRAPAERPRSSEDDSGDGDGLLRADLPLSEEV